jgi:hypothetical protein
MEEPSTILENYIKWGIIGPEQSNINDIDWRGPYENFISTRDEHYESISIWYQSANITEESEFYTIDAYNQWLGNKDIFDTNSEIMWQSLIGKSLTQEQYDDYINSLSKLMESLKLLFMVVDRDTFTEYNCDRISVTYTLVAPYYYYSSEDPVTVVLEKNGEGNYYLEIDENNYQIVNNGIEWKLTSTEETACDVSYSITYIDETGEYTFCLNQTGLFNGSWEYSGYPDIPINRFWRLFYNSILQRWFITTTTDLTTIVAQSQPVAQTICPVNNLLLNWEIGEDYSSLYSISTQNCINSLTQATLSSDAPCPFGDYTMVDGSIFSAFEVTPI